MNKGLRKLIHKKYDTITINEFYTLYKSKIPILFFTIK